MRAGSGASASHGARRRAAPVRVNGGGRSVSALASSATKQAQSVRQVAPKTSATDAERTSRRAGGQPQRAPLMLLVFVAGVVSLALEICAPRLLAPYFGTSLLIWAIDISLFLLYLAAGYFFGGRLADRHPSMRALCGLVAAAALAIGLIPFISRPILDWSIQGLDTANAFIFVTSLLAVMLLFAVPVTLLGFVAPYAVRLSVDGVGGSGRSAGTLYALSTTGSIVGALLPALFLIEDIGVRRTLFAASVTLLAVALVGLTQRGRLAAGIPGVLLLVPLLAPGLVGLGPLKNESGLIFERESLYNYIQVVKGTDGTMNLVLNEGQAIHSVYNPSHVLTGWYWDYFLAAPYFYEQPAGAVVAPVRNVAIVGLAAGTVAHQFSAVYGSAARIDGVEIDPDIVSIGRQYFGMTEPNLHTHIEDGRTFMRATHGTFDVVAIDAFQQPYIPFQLTTKEFFEEIRAHLSPHGVVCLNTGHSSTDFRLAQAFVNTLRQVFPSVYTFNVPNTFNTEVMATAQPTSLATFEQNMQRLQVAAPAEQVNLDAQTPAAVMATIAGEVAPVAQVAHAARNGVVFTDDEAPVEQLTDQLIFNYIKHGS